MCNDVFRPFSFFLLSVMCSGTHAQSDLLCLAQSYDYDYYLAFTLFSYLSRACDLLALTQTDAYVLTQMRARGTPKHCMTTIGLKTMRNSRSVPLQLLLSKTTKKKILRHSGLWPCTSFSLALACSRPMSLTCKLCCYASPFQSAGPLWQATP